MKASNFLLFIIFAMSHFGLLMRFTQAKLPQQEVDALEEIASTMGAKYWKFINDDSCQIEMVGVAENRPTGAESSISCNCTSAINTCHVVSIELKRLNLPGVLPPQLVKLPFLEKIDFAYNYLSGTIPPEWASLRLTNISLLVNRLSGKIPKELGNITSLTYLCLEANQFFGSLPPELGNLINLQTLMLSSNNLTGTLPMTFTKLGNLTDLLVVIMYMISFMVSILVSLVHFVIECSRINDNNLNGRIPVLIQNWKQLQRLELHASGFEGPIPSQISLLVELTELRISDISGPEQNFPTLNGTTGLVRLVLRNCNISGKIPSYIWTRKSLELLDLSFNNLEGEISETMMMKHIRFIDLSYNNFTWQGPDEYTCLESRNLNLNLFRSSSSWNTSRGLPCLKDSNCRRYSTCWHVNSGGKDVNVKNNNNNKELLYEGDGDVEGGTAKLFLNEKNDWGFSSTGDFLDDNDFQNKFYVANLPSSNMSELYKSARIAPISLTYFHHCLENGNYTVNLHFAEIQFTNGQTYESLGRRIFDIYVQEKLMLKDFNIVHEAGGAQKPRVIPLNSVSVTDNVLEIRFYFAGKGTTRIPERSVYGPLISAISVVSNSKHCSNGGNNETTSIIVGVVIGALCLIFIVLGILCWKGYFKGRSKGNKDLKGLEMQTGIFTLKQIKAATSDFDYANKIGEGGFGPVYKGQLPDGTAIAVKQLSSRSRQGNREFLNEIGMISCLQHPNLVKLHGCCIEADQLMLVYEYMENNSLARALFDSRFQIPLNWSTRHKICIGIARGLAFLHEESRLKIVHRDIKATNVLLDGDLNPKISDFGLARLDEEEKTHISTKIAGTIGYMAPEYALWGHLTYKADVYSFGVVVLEIVSGENNNNYIPSNDYVCLLDWACHLQQSGNLMELVDEKLGFEVDKKQAETTIRVALLCTHAAASLRPTMSEVVNMLQERMTVPEVVSEPSNYGSDLRFKAIRDLHKHRKDESSSVSHTKSLTTVMFHSSSSDDNGPSGLTPQSMVP
ncbi:probable LRR receptor-like serine/threonine-protein kinase RFK1 isoform X2 [Humulus lupulus]|uniref:probable LRR receptor-like serine/threonine-protein kinase RFK1 isoform X2 n=1 Tax=Humulus lupulus TaxID=3486 RepID=UPI002B40A5FB|nr:probable LRR receptor-like serine/threonine-protein kinase RFK1 isoform X2 [Humulus lupulus]